MSGVFDYHDVFLPLYKSTMATGNEENFGLMNTYHYLSNVFENTTQFVTLVELTPTKLVFLTLFQTIIYSLLLTLNRCLTYQNTSKVLEKNVFGHQLMI